MEYGVRFSGVGSNFFAYSTPVYNASEYELALANRKTERFGFMQGSCLHIGSFLLDVLKCATAGKMNLWKLGFPFTFLIVMYCNLVTKYAMYNRGPG